MRKTDLRAVILAAGLGLAPAAANAEGKLPPCPPGWAQENWVNPDVQTPKYVVGRILAMFPHTPDGLKQALPLVDAVFPGAKILPGDGGVLYVPGVGDIDVIAGAGTGGRSWRWYVLRDECAQSGLCDPPKRGPAAPGGSASSGGAGSGGDSGSGGGAGGGGAGGGGGSSGGKFTCNRFAEPAACWCGEWTDGIWAQRHYTAAHQCKPGFTLNGFPDSRWHEWSNGISEFIDYMESVFGSNNRDCDHPKSPPNWKEIERIYWKVQEFSGFSGTGLADIGKSCSKKSTAASPAKASKPAEVFKMR